MERDRQCQSIFQEGGNILLVGKACRAGPEPLLCIHLRRQLTPGRRDLLRTNECPRRNGEFPMAEPDDDWTTWLGQHGSALVLFARQFVAIRADAEDVVQEAFVRFWRSRQRIAEPAAYLFACVKHCALDWQRSRRRQQRRDQCAAQPEVNSLFTEAASHDERRSEIEAALRELPPDQAEVLVMKIWGGLTFPQIAVALETSSNTAASRYRYALAKLREALAEEPSYE